MPVSLFSMLSMGANALHTQQILLNIAGQNIANAATEGYTRQRADIVQHPDARIGRLLFGLGSNVATIERTREALIDDRFRRENSILGEFSLKAEYLTQVEDILAEPSQEGIAQALSSFFDSLQELANNPENEGVRSTVSGSGVALADSMNQSYELLNNLRMNLHEIVNGTVDEINNLVSGIADLNRKIGSLEAGSDTANASRDSRDLLLNELSELVSVEIRRNPNGTASVYLDGYALVQDFSSNSIGVRVNPGSSLPGDDLLEIVAVGAGNRPLNIESGKLGGLLDIRDNIVTDQVLADLDELSLKLIEEVNRIHSQGQGLVRFNSITSEYAVSDANIAIEDAGLPFTPVDGSFFLAVYDSEGQLLEQREITIDADTDTLNTIAAQINTAFGISGNLTATVTSDNRLVIETAAPDTTFSFISDDTQAGDTSDFLLGMGFNPFFTFDPDIGPAATIAVSSAIQEDPALIAAGFSTGPGDNRNALALAQLRNAGVLGANNNATLEEFYQTTLVSLGFATQEANDRSEIQSGVVAGIGNLRDSIAGVSLDEEGVNTIMAQQAYEASARFISAVNDVLEILLTEVG
jgi:flagellar hook-associated protein 1 FlgK